MSQRNEILAIFFVIVSTIGILLGVWGYQNYRLASEGVIVIRTRAPENGNFDPPRIELVAGQPAIIEIRNPETVSHGFAIPSINAGVQEIKPGHVERISVKFDSPGEYDFLC